MLASKQDVDEDIQWQPTAATMLEAQEEIRRRVTALMKDLNVNQTQFAERIGKTKAWISQRMNDHRRFSWADVQLLALTFSVPASEFMGWDPAGKARRLRERQEDMIRSEVIVKLAGGDPALLRDVEVVMRCPWDGLDSQGQEIYLSLYVYRKLGPCSDPGHHLAVQQEE